MTINPAAPVLALAVSTGIAYDTVEKIVHTEHPVLRRADFAIDAQSAMRPDRQFCEPTLIHRYITPQRERIEESCQHQATIIDCTTRTATFLDLTGHDYSVVSLDAVGNDPAVLGAIAEQKAMWAKISVTSRTVTERDQLGVTAVDGVLTNAFFVMTDHSTSVRTTDSSLQPQEVEMNDSWTYYFLEQPLPQLTCADAAGPWLTRYENVYSPESGVATWKVPSPSPLPPFDDKTTDSGPPIPAWRVPLFGVGKHMQHQGTWHYDTYLFELESGNIRPIRSDDPVFSVPAGFTTAPSVPSGG
jgi:hypothetical protein